MIIYHLPMPVSINIYIFVKYSCYIMQFYFPLVPFAQSEVLFRKRARTIHPRIEKFYSVALFKYKNKRSII